MESWKFRNLLSSAKNGNTRSESELISYINSASKSTNRKMRALEKADMDFYSYDIPKAALDYMGRKRFKENWTIETAENNWDDFQTSAKAVFRFTEKERHTTPTALSRYSSARLNYLLDIVEKAYPNSDFSSIKNPSSESELAKRKFFERAISRGALSELISAGYGSTDETLEQLESAFESGSSLDAINSKIEPYLAQLQLSGQHATIQDIWKLIQ